MEKLGVALLGLDHWYSAFAMLPQIVGSERVRLVSLSHDDEAKARTVGQQYGAPLVTTDYRVALDRPDVDMVVTLYSTDRNVAICQAAAALGKHIISVKPMATDLQGADQIAAAVQAAGVHFFPLECQRRLSAESKRLKQWVDEGRIGRPLRYTQTLNSALPLAWPGASDAGWWLDPARVPGGAWIDHAIYAIDTVRWLLGSELVSVQGSLGNMRYPELAMEDYGLAVYTLANGALAVIEDTWTADRGYGHSRTELIGMGGSIVEEGGASRRIVVKGQFGFEGQVTLEPLNGTDVTVVDHVAACIREETAPIATIADGRASLAACLEFYRSAQKVAR